MLTPVTDGFRIRIACVPVKDLFAFMPGIWLLGVFIQPENVLIFLIWGCGGNVDTLSQIHMLGRIFAFIRANGRCCSIMGCLVLDGEVEDFLVCKAFFEVRISNAAQIDLFLNLQLVIIREVERHRHVGFPHTAFHIVHGKGVLFAFVEWKSSALRVEINALLIICYGLDNATFFIFITF